MVVAVTVAPAHRMPAVPGVNLLQESGRVAAFVEGAVVQAPLEDLHPVQIRVQGALYRVDHTDAAAGPARGAPIIIGRVDFVLLDPPQHRLAGTDLFQVVKPSDLAARTAAADFRPDRPGEGFHGVVQRADSALAGEPCDIRQMTFGRPLLQQGGFGGVEADNEDARRHSLSSL